MTTSGLQSSGKRDGFGFATVHMQGEDTVHGNRIGSHVGVRLAVPFPCIVRDRTKRVGKPYP
jgi:hypothetical protein